MKTRLFTLSRPYVLGLLLMEIAVLCLFWSYHNQRQHALQQEVQQIHAFKQAQQRVQPTLRQLSKNLLAAIEKQDSNQVLVLIKAGADVNIVGLDESTPLVEAASSLNADCIRALLQHGAMIEARDCSGDTALLNAVRNDNIEAAQVLLANGANPNAADNYERTALWEAASGGNSTLVRLLLTYHAHTDKADWREQTPLMGACCYSDAEHVECVRLLLRSHANVKCKDIYDGTALEAAKMFHVRDTIRLLSRYGAKR